EKPRDRRADPGEELAARGRLEDEHGEAQLERARADDETQTRTGSRTEEPREEEHREEAGQAQESVHELPRQRGRTSVRVGRSEENARDIEPDPSRSSSAQIEGSIGAAQRAISSRSRSRSSGVFARLL